MKLSSSIARAVALVPALTLVATAAPACGDSVRDVLAVHRPALDGLRQKLAHIAAKLPAAGSVTQAAGKPVGGKLTYNYTEGGTLDLLPVEQLTDLKAKPTFDFLPQGPIGRALSLEGPGLDLDDTASDYLVKKLTVAEGVRWVGIVRIVKYEPAVVLDKSYLGGKVHGEVFVADLGDETIVAAAPFDAKPEDKLEFEYRADGDAVAAGTRALEESIGRDARFAIEHALKVTLGATVKIM